VWTGAWNPLPLITLEFTGEHNAGRLPSGNFTQTLVLATGCGSTSRRIVDRELRATTPTALIGTNTRLR
jgi:hypothetical protein